LVVSRRPSAINKKEKEVLVKGIKRREMVTFWSNGGGRWFTYTVKVVFLSLLSDLENGVFLSDKRQVPEEKPYCFV
jgi:hypothetical protein